MFFFLTFHCKFISWPNLFDFAINKFGVLFHSFFFSFSICISFSPLSLSLYLGLDCWPHLESVDSALLRFSIWTIAIAWHPRNGTSRDWYLKKSEYSFIATWIPKLISICLLICFYLVCLKSAMSSLIEVFRVLDTGETISMRFQANKKISLRVYFIYFILYTLYTGCPLRYRYDIRSSISYTN